MPVAPGPLTELQIEEEITRMNNEFANPTSLRDSAKILGGFRKLLPHFRVGTTLIEYKLFILSNIHENIVILII